MYYRAIRMTDMLVLPSRCETFAMNESVNKLSICHVLYFMVMSFFCQHVHYFVIVNLPKTEAVARYIDI